METAVRRYTRRYLLGLPDIIYKGELVTTIRVTVGEHKDTIRYGPGCLTVTKSDPSLYQSELLAW